MVTAVNSAITKVNSALGQLGTGATALQNQLAFVQDLQDTLDNGIGNLVNANLGKESAQLIALQTKQQLGIQALSIANQSSRAAQPVPVALDVRGGGRGCSAPAALSVTECRHDPDRQSS